MPFGDRLREERERLGMSQPKFAALAETTKQTLFSWETSKTAPDGFQLAALHKAGVDVLFVITGKHTGAASAPPMPDLGTIELAVEYVRNREQLEKRKLTAAQFAKAVRLAYQITFEEQTAGVSPGGEIKESIDGSRRGQRTKTT